MPPLFTPGAERVLICGPVFPPGLGGGLPLALEDLAQALTDRGWAVDLATTPDTLDWNAGDTPPAVMPWWAASRWAAVPRLRALPAGVRTLLQHVLLGGGVARTQSRAMRAIEHRLRHRPYAAVVAVLYKATPGFAHFILARHPRVLLVSLDGLGSELRLAPWLWVPRMLARLMWGRLHRDLFRPVRPSRIEAVVFASNAWRDEALAAGVPPAAARVIPFGIARPAPLEERPRSRGRLLWVGRCSPEKGLHVFLEAVALLRRTRPVRLTAVCGVGPERYRDRIQDLIRRLDLRDVVELHSPVPRGDLASFYARHDALLFASPFREPVALVLMEAFGAGIPVVAPRPAGASMLIEPDQTCVCFDALDPTAVAVAATRALDDEVLRRHVRTRAHARVRSGPLSLEGMGRAYDAVLRSLSPRQEERA